MTRWGLRTLRWQITFALFALVLVTVLISWLLAVRFTIRGFDAFVEATAEEQAWEYAQLLEVRYNLLGEFGDLSEFLIDQTGYAPPESETREDLLVDEFDLLGWDAIVAQELGLSREAYWLALETAAPAEVAEDRGSTSDAIVSAIMRWEVTQRMANRGDDPSEALFLLAQLLGAVEDYAEGWYEHLWGEAWESEWEDEPFHSLLYDAPILVVDLQGDILFNGSQSTDPLEWRDALTTEGFPIRDWATGKPVGTVRSTRQPGAFDVAETTFIGQTENGLLLGGLAAAGFALLLGGFMARRLSKPISALRDSAVALSQGDHVGRLPVTRGELGSMSAAFNAMADSLDQQRDVRGRLISDLSHELNTPLSVIQLEIEALRDGLQTSEEAAERVLSELALLRNLASDVGLLAENEAGLLTLQKERVDLNEFLPLMVDRWRTQAESAGIQLSTVVSDEGINVEADRTRLSQALGNLIRNALQHTASGGRIEVTCSRQPVERLGGFWTTLCIHDSGAGIASDDLERIFERTVRANANQSGRGLGLTIVRQIVDAHGGHVWAESTVGVGSSFCIALP